MSKPEKQYYALLVGINDYPAPISKLNGCLKDLDQVEHYLRSQLGTEEQFHERKTTSGLPVRTYGALHLCRLENQQATYLNIIAGFQEFLKGAAPQDIAWFHFSGHGSEQFTAEEFLEIEPNGKDQTLVCYRDQPGAQLHLADKELAFLLHEIETRDLEDHPKESPHIIVSLDCCHSGSGTRDFEMNRDLQSRKTDLLPAGATRSEAAEKKLGVRSLDSYAGDYAAQWNRAKHLEVPLSKHVLISACESVQLAGDLPTGGIFTSGLIHALKGAGGNLNYSDLYIRTRAAVQKIRGHEQTPQFETLGEFDPYTRFLDGSALGSPSYYEILREGQRWLVKCGAIHGIPLASRQTTKVEIRTAAPENKAIGTAELTNVGAQKSVLKLKDGLKLEPEKQYQAILKFLPAPPVLVWLHGDNKGTEALRKVWDPSGNIKLVDDLETFGEAQLEVEVTTAHYKIHDRRTGKLFAGLSVNAEYANLIVVGMLNKIVNWERFLHLQNEQSAIKNWLRFEIDVSRNPHQPFLTIKEPETIIPASPDQFIEHNGGLGAFFNPYIRSFEKPAQELYAYLFHLRSDYSITSYEGEVVYRPDEYKQARSLQIPLLKKIKGWGIGAEENQAVSYFKLLITTEAFNYQQLLQSGIHSDHRDVDFDWDPFNVENDWYCITLKVILEWAE